MKQSLQKYRVGIVGVGIVSILVNIDLNYEIEKQN